MSFYFIKIKRSKTTSNFNNTEIIKSMNSFSKNDKMNDDFALKNNHLLLRRYVNNNQL